MSGYEMLQNALVVAFATAVLGWMVGGLRRETRRAWQGLRTEMREEIGGVRGELSGLRTVMREEIGALRTEMREGIGGVRGELSGLRTEMREEIGALRTETHDELRALRSDLTQVALALGVRRRVGNE